MPDKRYQQEHPDAAAFEENPAFGAAFENALLLRLRFAGWGLVQLATDPDPPTDEAGCAGTHMLHSADGDRRLDRALVWQDSDPTHTIRREPRADLPALGVNCAQVSLVVTDGTASSGYSPLQIVQSSGAVQTSGVAQVLSVDGLNDLLTLTPQEILGDGRELRVDLLAKNGQKPFLNGYNHLVWQDGEPIDPFVLALFADAPAAGDGASPQLIFHREIFNQGLTLMQMNPLQRLESSRAPCGFDWDLSHIPDWARERLSDEERELIGRPGYPGSYLAQRASVLAGDLAARLGGGGDASRAAVDEIVSLAERMRLVSVPRHTTPVWLMILLHYGHTISGALTAGEADNPVFAAFADRLGLRLSLTESADRKAPNSRWLVAYTKGVMDTDALSDLVFGELYVPVAAEPTDSPISIAQPWSFPATMADAVRAYACTFAAPFWAPYEVSGDERRLTLADGTVLVETLASQGEDSYSYTTTGIDGVTDLRASFSLGAPDPGERVPLEWRSSFQAADAASVVSALTVIGRAASQMTAAMSTEFAPRLSAP